jgi:ornithine cyclodeaminase/alanine dehydrogenase-like protein (mu-crystallin family)
MTVAANFAVLLASRVVLGAAEGPAFPLGPKAGRRSPRSCPKIRVVVDHCGQCRKGLPYGALRRHVDTDKLNEHNLHAELGQIVAGVKPGRQNDQETILFWHRGLSLSDLALGHAMLEKAKALGVGRTLRFSYHGGAERVKFPAR